VYEARTHGSVRGIVPQQALWHHPTRFIPEECGENSAKANPSGDANTKATGMGDDLQR